MSSQLINALNSLSPLLQSTLTPLIAHPSFDATFSPDDLNRLCQTTGLSLSELSLALLPIAAAYSVAPISHFHVGALARGQSGRLYIGANMEFVGMGLSQSVHAEQSAISHAWLKGETTVAEMTINYSPCGHCRQFMNELNQAEQLRIQLPNAQVKTLHHYLPDPFGPADLNVTDPLLSPVDHNLELSQHHNAVVTAAIKAANRTHAPYSKHICGLALEDDQGQIFSGMYAENAAFNPSLAPLQVALVNLNLHGKTPAVIKRVVLVEKQHSAICLRHDTEKLLALINPQAAFEYLAL